MNEQAFNEVVHQHRDKIYRLCRGYLYDQSLADDLYQEVLINLWHSLKKFRGDASLSTWIYRVTVNTAITFNRQSKRQPPQAEISLMLSDEGALQKEEVLEREQQLNRLQYCISQLPKEERLIITLVLEDVSYKEIAEVMGISVNYTGVKIKRIKERLGKMMESSTTQKF
jgi:RNA polymerase sigma-70 factor (ECF subfamily)